VTTSPATGGPSGPCGPSGRRGGLTARFLLAVGQEVGVDVLTPDALARAVGTVLPVDGAGLSTFVDLRPVPLGSSSDDVATAEELQSSLGEGPCLDAQRAPVAVTADDLATRWPSYTAALNAQTVFRSVASIPLRSPRRGVFAALDLYSASPRLDASLDLAEIDRRLAAPAAALLTTCVAQVHDVELPQARSEWCETAAGRRHNVWVAIGMIMTRSPGPSRDAVSLPHAHTGSQDRVATSGFVGRAATTT
jgi:hypothetical protein